MKRTALLIGLVFAVSVAVGGDLAQLEMVAGGDPVEGWWLLRFFEGTEHEREYEIQRPLNDWMSGYRNRRPAPDISTPTRTELAVTPSDPTAGEPVYLQVSCWMPASNYGVDEADLTIQGHQITVTLNWVCQGIGFQAFN